MSDMRVSVQIFLLFVLVVLVGCALGPPVHMAVLGVFSSAHLPFDRVLSRVFMVLALLFLLLCRRSLRVQESLRQSLSVSPRWFFLLRTGFALGVASLFFLLLFFHFCGAVRFHALEIPVQKLMIKFLNALAMGVIVALIEEIFFRGFVLQSLMQEMKVRRALLVTSIFYALLHYFKATQHVYLDRLDWSAGFTTALAFLAPFKNISTMIPGVVGLTLVGLALGLAYLRTGSLYLSIGLHAGWVFMLKFYGNFTSRVPDASPTWFGDEKIVTGIAAWAMLLVVIALVSFWGKRLAATGQDEQT